jgi:hypothetical protein
MWTVVDAQAIRGGAVVQEAPQGSKRALFVDGQSADGVVTTPDRRLRRFLDTGRAP